MATNPNGGAMYERKTYKVRIIKRNTGEVIEGTMNWDGLADLVAVEGTDGQQHWISSLDRWESVEAVA
jgi:hypothetical protein